MAPLITIIEKQVVWLVTNIYTNRYTSTGRTELTIYGKEQDAITEFTRRIRKAQPDEVKFYDYDHAQLQVDLGLANGCYQYDAGEDIVVICLDKDVDN